MPSFRRPKDARTIDTPSVPIKPPDPHPSGAKPPNLPKEFVPKHVAVVMDGNRRWAKAHGVPRNEGHKRGEEAVMDVVHGAIEIGVEWLSLYAFSTENWKRSPDEVRFLMNFNRDVIHRRVDEFDALGVWVRWAGRMPRLWRSVVNELLIAQERTKGHSVLNLVMCVNYGGRAEVVDAVQAIAQLVADKKIKPDQVNEQMLARHMYQPDMPDVDLFIRPSGEERTSNFMVWQAAYAELVFQDILWPDFSRIHLWRACEEYARRDRRFGGVVEAAEGGR